MSGQRRPNLPPQQQQQQQPPTGVPRQNEYFVPRDGIDREVITADICRYLGNDALVRPGTYEHPDGRVTQGYYITAYRNLTSAMIQDLKADSARWDAERRAASRSQPGAAGAPSRGGNDGYRNSETHHQRQYYGPTSADPTYGDAMAVDPPSYNQPPMRYPGTGNQGYNGVNSGSSYAAHQQRYEPQQSSYIPTTAAQYVAAQQTYSPGPQAPDMYAAGIPAGGAGLVPQPAFGQPPNVPDSQYVRGSAYAQNSMVTTSIQNRNLYPTAGAVYQPAPDYGYAQPVGQTVPATGYIQSIDVAYGRGSSSQQPNTIPAPSDYLASPAGNPQQTGYSTVLPDSQYDESQAQPKLQSQNPAQPPSRNSVTPASSSQAQMSNSGQTSSSSTNPRRERDQDRHRREDRDRDNTDRHAAERHAHRHRTR